MRKIIFIFLVFSNFLILTCKGQPFNSVFGKGLTQWNVIHRIPDAMPTNIYKAFGDTIINEKHYKFLDNGYWYYFGKRYGFLREDTTTGKLWFLNLDKKEQLIMDLSLSKSDTFMFSNGTLYTVDSIFYKNGTKYLWFNKDSRDSILFIEGIGPNNFLLPEYALVPTFAQLRCMFKDGTIFYHNEDYFNCVDTTTEVNSINKISNLVYPNPARDFLKINLIKNNAYHIEIHNSIGVLVYSKMPDDNYIINIEKFAKGIYYIKILVNSDVYLTKFLKL